MAEPLRVLAIAGSLRRESLNGALVRAAAELAPPGLSVGVRTLRGIPLYDRDLEDAGPPGAVAALGTEVAAADGLVIATPEYQHGVPGVLKNALDWLARPPGAAPLEEIPVMVMGASPGMTGTARAQAQLRQTLVFSRCRTMPPPELLVARAHEKIAGGRLEDEDTRERLRAALERFAAWIRALPRPPRAA